ncbi:MAG: YHS domain-containing protein [Thiobacillus sp.]|jgi:YHS domain-containing protein|nr:YHS domain-containing protein [Thiobacillus sp.]
MSSLVKDPVCGMEVDARQLDTVYQGIHYAFCSTQCQERFVANPHLYIGHPGQAAPKQEGRVVLKRRSLLLGVPLSAEQADRLVASLMEMMGVESASVSGERLEIVYDLLQATEQQIGARLGETGLALGEGWPERLRRAFVHYLEQCEADSLECRPPRGHAMHGK